MTTIRETKSEKRKTIEHVDNFFHAGERSISKKLRRFSSAKPVSFDTTMVGLLLVALTMDDDIKDEFVAVRGEIRGAETALRQEIRDEAIATRRHFDTVAESLRDDIRIIAEGLIALDAKVETIRDSG